ncbi:uncharacterized protein LOC110242428 [Exaiptasia diaphana]|uniref:Chitin-binding type-2 domain-containing protein n=1 Tax=Exaiptasia diaphana TaxID=2652724 RepID=A0A913XGJ3_EXADI|nr:uncharacterized protein LOC110242428 [Exaiptasia diaphana]
MVALMKALLLVYVCLSFAVFSLNGEGNCPQLKKVGCFKSIDEISKEKFLSKLALTDRPNIDWKNWNNYLRDLACKCAERVGEGNGEIRTFGLEFYGECWTSRNSPFKLETLKSEYASDNCYGPNFEKCNVSNSNEQCAGGADTIAVYQFGFCLFRPDGIYTDPNDCSGFLQCYNNQKLNFKCPTGKLYNVEKKYCDSPSNVNCSGRPTT